MNLACSTVIFRELDTVSALGLIALAGFKNVELVIVPGFCDHFDLTTDNFSQINQLKKYLKQSGLSIVALCIDPWIFNTSSSDQGIRIIKRGVKLAAQLDLKLVTLSAGAKMDQSLQEQAMDKIVPQLQEAADCAGKQGIVISIELPHQGSMAENVRDTIQYFDRLSDDRIKCTFDTSHVCIGERISAAEGFKQIDPKRIMHVHLRDVLGEDISVTPGKGHVDFKSFFDEIKRCNYKGYLSIELECWNLTMERRRLELIFAKRFLENLWHELELPLSIKLQTHPIYKLMDRLFHNPKQELKRHPFSARLLQMIRPYYARLKPIQIYEGSWKSRTRIRRAPKIFIPKANSVFLKVAPHRTLTVCILGCGYAGHMHGLGFRRLSGVKLGGACDIDEVKAKNLGQQLKCASYSSLRKMIDVEKPDIVSVCTREWQHYEAVMLLLEEDIDIFCEKIMATTYREAKEMLDFAKARHRMLAINYNYRFMPGIQKIKDVISNQYFGKLQLINIKVHAFSYHHALDLVSYLGGDIQSVRAYFCNENSIREFGGTDWNKYDPDILYVPSKNLAAIFELKNEASIVITSSYFYNPSGFILSLDAVFDDGAVTLNGINMHNVVGNLSWTSRKQVQGLNMNIKKGVFAKGYELTFCRSIESFMNAYLLNMPSETPAEQGLLNIRIEQAVCRANASGKKSYIC